MAGPREHHRETVFESMCDARMCGCAEDAKSWRLFGESPEVREAFSNWSDALLARDEPLFQSVLRRSADFPQPSPRPALFLRTMIMALASCTFVRSAVLRTAGTSNQHCRRHLQTAVSAAVDSSGGSAVGPAGGVAPPDVRRLAQMAHIEVTDQEVAEWGPKIESIVQWFGQLQNVDLEGVPPALRADVDGSNAFREDAPREFANRCAADFGAGKAGQRAGVRCP